MPIMQTARYAMKFPRFLFVQAILNIPAVLFYMLIGLVLIIALIADEGSSLNLNVISIGFIVFGNLSWIAGIAASVFWFRRSKYSYAVLLAYIITLLVPLGIAFSTLIIDGKKHQSAEYIALAVLGVYPAWLCLLSLRPYHIRWARSQGRLSETVLNPRCLLPVAIVVLLIIGGSLAVNAVGIGTRLDTSLFAFTSSSGSQDGAAGSIAGVYDGNSSTFWMPKYGNGVDQWIRIGMPAPGAAVPAVSEIRIAFDSDRKFGSYSRAKTVLVETSDGRRFLHELKDVSGEQSIPLEEKRCEWIQLTFKSVYPGREKESLCVSEISLHGKKRNLVAMLPF